MLSIDLTYLKLCTAEICRLIRHTSQTFNLTGKSHKKSFTPLLLMSAYVISTVVGMLFISSLRTLERFHKMQLIDQGCELMSWMTNVFRSNFFFFFFSFRSCLLWAGSVRLWQIWPKLSSCSPQPAFTDTEERCSSSPRSDHHMSHMFMRTPMSLHCTVVGWPSALPSHQDYVAAMEDFQQSLELKRNQPIAMLYKGLTFFHRGMLKVCRWLASSFLMII